MRLAFLFCAIFMAQPLFAGDVVAQLSPNKPTWRLIGNLTIEAGGLKCGLVAVSSLDNKIVKILRVDPPGKKYDTDYFLAHPNEFSREGKTIVLDHEFDLVGKQVKSVSTFALFEEKNKDLRIDVRVDDSHPMQKLVPVDEYFVPSTRCVQ